MQTIKIDSRVIGDNEKVFIIAEAGVNHNGDVNLAQKLIDKAKECGADAVKFQTYKTENLVSKKLLRAQFSILKRLELDYEIFKELKKYCDKKNIIFLSTPHTEDAVDFLKELVPAYKIASSDLTNLPFLQKVAKKNKPIILSCGMATLKEIEEAVNRILKFNKKLILLHCTSAYPAPFDECSLLTIKTLKEKFNLIVGYSDHTKGIEASIAAVTLGAKVIEKHFTLNKSLPGPDHKASLDVDEFKILVESIKNIEKALMGDKKVLRLSERKTKLISRKGIFAKVDIEKGEKIKPNMIEIKRPQKGIQPKYLPDVIGKIAKVRIKKDTPISWNLLL